MIFEDRRPAGKVQHAACVFLATTRLDVNKRVSEQLGVRELSFASSEATREVTGVMIGGVTRFSLSGGSPYRGKVDSPTPPVVRPLRSNATYPPRPIAAKANHWIAYARCDPSVSSRAGTGTGKGPAWAGT